MNCDQRNSLLVTGNLDRDDVWPKIKEYESRRFQFRWEFGLDELPQEPGLITIRGPRQYGKSTWLEFQLLKTIEDFGKATGFILNGDEIYSHEEFEKKLLDLEVSFAKRAKVKRIFIDEITSIVQWEKVIKRLADQGRLKDVLIVTTGSNASDLRRGTERLPGRKGRLPRNDYIFLPVSYREYLYQTREEIGVFSSDRLYAYILSGGSPYAIQELYYSECLTDTFLNLIKDWLLGDIISSGRSRVFLLNLIRRLYEHGAGTVSYTKLAREAGLANNTAAHDYVEKLSDLFCILPAMQWDPKNKVALARKPSKIHFINLAVAMAFHPQSLRYIHEVRELKGQPKAALSEWIVAQELWRRYHLKSQRENLPLNIADELTYWSSDHHEVDFVVGGNDFYEVKAGKVSPFEFTWFEKVYPKKTLNVISESSFEAKFVKGMTIEQFLLDAPSELYFDEDKYRFPDEKSAE